MYVIVMTTIWDIVNLKIINRGGSSDFGGGKAKGYHYAYPHPAVATDIVVFSLREVSKHDKDKKLLHVLLIKRGQAPYKGEWALPGGFVNPKETLDQCAKRELTEETGFVVLEPKQFAIYSIPGRDPREWVISVAYVALAFSDEIELRADTDAAQAQWFRVDKLPKLAFDHDKILQDGVEYIRSWVDRDILPLLAFLKHRDCFTLPELYGIYVAVKGQDLDKANFWRRIKGKEGMIVPITEGNGVKAKESGVKHRPAQFYKALWS